MLALGIPPCDVVKEIWIFWMVFFGGGGNLGILEVYVRFMFHIPA